MLHWFCMPRCAGVVQRSDTLLSMIGHCLFDSKRHIYCSLNSPSVAATCFACSSLVFGLYLSCLQWWCNNCSACGASVLVHAAANGSSTHAKEVAARGTMIHPACPHCGTHRCIAEWACVLVKRHCGLHCQTWWMPVYFISVLRLATEQHSTLPQKGGINGRVYLFYNSRAQDPHSGWSRRGTAQGGERVWWVDFSYYIKYFIKYIFIQTYQVYFMKIYIWKRRKPASAKHRRIFLPIWFHSLPILPGSAAGAAALKSGDAVRWWWLSIALATRGRAVPPTLPKILQPGGVFTFFGVWGGQKEGEISRCVLEI